MKKLLLAALIGLGVSASAQAELFGFTCITNNNALDCGIGEAQLSMDVTALGATQVQFRFTNIGPGQSSVEQINFDFGGIPDFLQSPFASLNESAGVNFIQATPGPNLPGGNTVSFVSTTSAVAEPPPVANGINNTAAGEEWLEIIFDLATGATFDDVLDELNATDDSVLRVGMHVIGFASGGSESFINEGGGGGQEVPEPGSLALLGLALAGLGVMRRRFA